MPPASHRNFEMQSGFIRYYNSNRSKKFSLKPNLSNIKSKENYLPKKGTYQNENNVVDINNEAIIKNNKLSASTGSGCEQTSGALLDYNNLHLQPGKHQNYDPMSGSENSWSDMEGETPGKC